MEENENFEEFEANDIGKEIRFLLFSVLTVALFMLTVTLGYSLFIR